MAKIRLEYDISGGDYCKHLFEDNDIIKPCRFLYDDWCMIFGSKTVLTVEGHTILNNRLYACKHAEIKPEAQSS